MHKYAFLKKNGFSGVLYQILVQFVINWSSRPQKRQTLEILTKVDFLRIVLKYHIFPDFLNSLIARAKIVACILYFDLN